MACNSRSSCGPDFEQMRLWLKGIILELLNDGTLQAGLKDCEGEWLGKARNVVLCDKLADLLCDLINEGKLCVPKIAGFTADCDTKTLTITMADGTELTADASCFGGAGSDGNTTITGFTYAPDTGVVTITESNGKSWPITIVRNKVMGWQPETQVVSVTDTNDHTVSVPVVFAKAPEPPRSSFTQPTHFIGKSADVVLAEPGDWMYFLTADGRRGRIPVYFDDQVINRCPIFKPTYTGQSNRDAFEYRLAEMEGQPIQVTLEYYGDNNGHNWIVDQGSYTYDATRAVAYMQNLYDQASQQGQQYPELDTGTYVLTNVGWIDYTELSAAPANGLVAAKAVVWQDGTESRGVVPSVKFEYAQVGTKINGDAPDTGIYPRVFPIEGTNPILAACGNSHLLSVKVYGVHNYEIVNAGETDVGRVEPKEFVLDLEKLMRGKSKTTGDIRFFRDIMHFNDYIDGPAAFREYLTAVVQEWVQYAESLQPTDSLQQGGTHRVIKHTAQLIETPWGIIDTTQFNQPNANVNFYTALGQLPEFIEGVGYQIIDSNTTGHGMVFIPGPNVYGWEWHTRYETTESLNTKAEKPFGERAEIYPKRYSII